MSTDLILSPADGEEVIIDPMSGEVLPLHEADDQFLARVIGEIKRRKDELWRLEKYLGREAIRRMDSNALWTIRAEGVKLTAPSAVEEKVTWDAELLHELLDGAVADGLISREAALRACSTKVEHVAHAAGIKALLKIPALAERIEKAQRSEPAPDRNIRVSVTP